eukprot:1142553-Pelagomonas_calceolata.AAC.2
MFTLAWLDSFPQTKFHCSYKSSCLKSPTFRHADASKEQILRQIWVLACYMERQHAGEACRGHCTGLLVHGAVHADAKVDNCEGSAGVIN